MNFLNIKFSVNIFVETVIKKKSEFLDEYKVKRKNSIYLKHTYFVIL